MEKYAIIVAGGKGERMNAQLPKQFLNIGGKPILMHTLLSFYRYDSNTKLILVLPEDQIEFWRELCKQYEFELKHKIVAGGQTRFHSVKNGLAEVPNGCLVGVHDGVRPFAALDTMNRCYTFAEKQIAVIPVIDAVDSIRYTDENENYAVDRSKFKLVQTPQVFHSDILHKAYQQEFNDKFTDDASVVEALGIKVSLTDGNRENIKITTKFDLAVAEAILNN